jgi:HEAT repeat protein
MMDRALVACLLTVGAMAFLPSHSGHGIFELTAQDTRGFSGPASSEAWETLSKGLADGNAEHRKKAIAAAGTIGPVKEAVEMVVKALQDKDTSVRQTAAVALGEMKSPDAIPALKAALDDNPEVSFTVAKALWVLGDADSSRDIFQAVLAGERKDTPGKMHNAMRDAKHKLSPGQLALMGIKEAAGLFGPASIAIEAVEEAMKEAKKDSGTPGRAMAAGVLATDSDPYALVLLEWALGDGSWAVRLAVAKALGERGTPDTIPKLLPLLSDDHHAVRYMAAASIVKLGAKKAALATD